MFRRRKKLSLPQETTRIPAWVSEDEFEQALVDSGLYPIFEFLYPSYESQLN